MNTNNRDERGAALVEFAIMLPILIVLLFGVIDYGRLLYTRISLEKIAWLAVSTRASKVVPPRWVSVISDVA